MRRLSISLMTGLFFAVPAQAADEPVIFEAESGGGTPNEPFTRTGPPLAQGKSKFLGCAWSAAQNTGFLNYWNQLVPENAGKWGSVEAVRDSYNWSSLDTAYHLAKDNGLPFRFHVLVWGNQQPGWITTLSATEQLEELEEWMSLVAERYPDIDWLEVVNEPISAPAPYREALGGEGETGWDWIVNAFRMARQHFPDTPLMINEYGIVNDGNKRGAYMEIIRILQAENLIDLVGVQSHAFNLTGGAANITDNLDGLAGLGLPIMVTELDVDGRKDPDPPDDNGAVDALSDATQLQGFQEYFPALFEHPAVMGVTLWGFRPGNWRENQDAHLVMRLGAERPAMKWLIDYMSRFETINFSEYLEELQLSPEEHAFDADVDRDGLATGLEYLLGLDPELTDPLPLEAGIDPKGFFLLLPVQKGLREGFLEIESSSDLESWTTRAFYDWGAAVSDNLDIVPEDHSDVIHFRDAPDSLSTGMFYRLSFHRAEPEG